MNKSIMVTVWVNDYPLGDIEDLQETLENVFEDYDEKRINIQIRDEPVVIGRPAR